MVISRVNLIYFSPTDTTEKTVRAIASAFDCEKQDVNSGGSGCGCSASVLCSHILKQMREGKLKKVLFVATGALMSPTSSKQGQPIPGIAHAVMLEV